MTKKKEEELKDEREENRSDDTGTGGEGNPNASPDSVGGSSSGGSGSGGSGEQGGEQGGSGGEQGGSGGKQESSRGDKKLDLLQSIRAKRANGQRDSSSPTDGASHEHSEGNERGLLGRSRGATDNDGTTPRTNRSNRRGGKQDSNGGSGSSEIEQRIDSRATIDADRIGREKSTLLENEKPAGVAIKGADKIKQLAKAATEAAKAEAPKLRFTWDKDPLTKKEGDEILPKIKGLLEFIFRHADKGITISNRNRAEAHIWSSIDDEDIEIIATHLVEMGKASRIVATAVRRMTNSYRLLQIGLITLPKFIQTYQFYAANGGFALGGVK